MWNEKGCFYFTVMCAEVQLYLKETQTFYLLFPWLHFLHFFISSQSITDILSFDGLKISQHIFPFSLIVHCIKEEVCFTVLTLKTLKDIYL